MTTSRPVAKRARRKTPQTPREAESQLRARIVATARRMAAMGLSPGRSGNVSARQPDAESGGMLITPSGIPYDVMTPEMIVPVAADGTFDAAGLKPSSEWRFHLSSYRARPEANAVVHTHSHYATVLACAHRAIPAFHYMVAVAGGSDIPCVPYATFGTEQLADHVAGGLAERRACLMANHGQIAVGETLEAALELAAEVETLAGQYWAVLALGEPKVLGPAEMAEVIERFKSYGQRGQTVNR